VEATVPTFGDRSRLCIEVGPADREQPADSMRVVDVWAADRWLTCDDNSVYVPHFAGCVQRAVARLLSDSWHRRGRPHPAVSVADCYRRLRAEAEVDNTEYLAYRFMDWGPTADNVSMLLFEEGGTAYLPFSFWRPDHHDPSEVGRVFVAELPAWELAGVLNDAAWSLMWGCADRSQWPVVEPRTTPDHGR
jgi:hypothetical protein